ncbi:hypothetical protein LB505_004173 [Fusarium chuoi]|nr:hypothetical protein LB505_004173 [Fusarium chuoi]
MNDIDASAMITRQEFEAMIEPLLARTHLPLEEALAQAKLTKDDIDVIEVVGGGSRVPALKERIQEFFGKPLSFTLNADEALAPVPFSPLFSVSETSPSRTSSATPSSSPGRRPPIFLTRTPA